MTSDPKSRTGCRDIVQPIEVVIALIALVTAIVSFLQLLQKNIGLVTGVSVALCLVAVVALGLRVRFSKKPSPHNPKVKVYTFPDRARRWALIGLIVAAVVVLGLGSGTAGWLVRARSTPAIATPSATSTGSATSTPGPTSVLTSPTVPTPGQTPDAVVNVGALHLRAGPDIAFPTVSAYAQGTPLEILGRQEDGKWVVAKAPDGQRGWINAGYLQVNIALSDVVILPTPLPPSALCQSATPPATAMPGNVSRQFGFEEELDDSISLAVCDADCSPWWSCCHEAPDRLARTEDGSSGSYALGCRVELLPGKRQVYSIRVLVHPPEVIDGLSADVYIPDAGQLYLVNVAVWPRGGEDWLVSGLWLGAEEGWLRLFLHSQQFASEDGKRIGESGIDEIHIDLYANEGSGQSSEMLVKVDNIELFYPLSRFWPTTPTP